MKIVVDYVFIGRIVLFSFLKLQNFLSFLDLLEQYRINSKASKIIDSFEVN